MQRFCGAGTWDVHLGIIRKAACKDIIDDIRNIADIISSAEWLRDLARKVQDAAFWKSLACSVLCWPNFQAVAEWVSDYHTGFVECRLLQLAAWSWDGLAAGSLLFKCLCLLARRRLFACLPPVGSYESWLMTHVGQLSSAGSVLMSSSELQAFAQKEWFDEASVDICTFRKCLNPTASWEYKCISITYRACKWTWAHCKWMQGLYIYIYISI